MAKKKETKQWDMPCAFCLGTGEVDVFNDNAEVEGTTKCVECDGQGGSNSPEPEVMEMEEVEESDG